MPVSLAKALGEYVVMFSLFLEPIDDIWDHAHLDFLSNHSGSTKVSEASIQGFAYVFSSFTHACQVPLGTLGKFVELGNVTKDVLSKASAMLR